MFACYDSLRLDELRQKDESLFRRAVESLFSIGYDNLTEEMVLEVIGKVNENLDSHEASVEEMRVLFDRMNLLCTARDIQEVSLPVLLDYIVEKGWRERV